MRRAVQYCKLVARNKGYPEATYKLALCYRHGYGDLEANKSTAEKYLIQAADEGHHNAKMQLYRHKPRTQVLVRI